MRKFALVTQQQLTDIIFKVIDKETGFKSYQFFVNKEKLINAINSGYGSFFDCDDTLRVYTQSEAYTQSDNTILFRFRYFEQHKGFDFEINLSKFMTYLMSDNTKKTYFLPVTHKLKSNQFVISSYKNLAIILQNKTLKKKFGRAIANLADTANDLIQISDDFCEYSFIFCKYRQGKFVYNGGLIFHKNNFEGSEAIIKGRYGLHT